MAAKSNGLRRTIEKKILQPAYMGMIAGLIIRSVALVLSAGIEYDTWPLFIRVAVEAMAALGMVGCADVVLSVASGRSAQMDREIAAARTSPMYNPNPRLRKEKYLQEKEALETRRQLAISNLTIERRKEWSAIIFCAGVTVTYGVLFGLVTLKHANAVSIITEIVGVAAIPFITYYLSAQYREEEDAAPDETAKSTALGVVDDKLQGIRERFKSGTETPQDVSLMDAATEGYDYHNRLVKRLAAKQSGKKYMTTPEIYEYFGAVDASSQANIRRIVREAGKKGDWGVMWDDEHKCWITPSDSLGDMFPQKKLARQVVAQPRIRPSRLRTKEAPSPEPADPNSEQRSDTARNDSDQPVIANIPAVEPPIDGISLALPE